MDKRLLLVCASAFLLAGPVEALTLFGTSSKEYVDRAVATLDAQTTLAQINTLNKTVMDKEKSRFHYVCRFAKKGSQCCHKA